MKPLRVVIAGGGTGGHLYPGIAVARELLRRCPDARITFAGTARGIESRVVPKEGFELDTLRSTGLKGTSLAARVRGLLLIPLSGIDAWSIVSRRAPFRQTKSARPAGAPGSPAPRRCPDTGGRRYHPPRSRREGASCILRTECRRDDVR